MIDCQVQEIACEIVLLCLLDGFLGIIEPVKLKAGIRQIGITGSIGRQTLALLGGSQRLVVLSKLPLNVSQVSWFWFRNRKLELDI